MADSSKKTAYTLMFKNINMHPIHIITFIACLLMCNNMQAQSNHFSVGVQSRITPIYVGKQITEGLFPASNILDEAEPNITGPGLSVDYRIKLKKQFELCIGTVLRYDRLYSENDFYIHSTGLEKRKIQRTFFLDNYADVKYNWGKNSGKTSKFAGLGILIAGIGTGYNKTQLYEINTVLYPTVTKEHYQFPAIFTSFGLRFKNYMNAEIRMGYCFSNPQRYFNNKFLFPELKFSYDLKLKK